MAAEAKGRAGSLEAQLAALAARVAQLERRSRARPRHTSPRGALRPPSSDLALLEQLRARRGPRYVGSGLRGAVAYGGAAVFGEREYLWIREHPLPELADLDAGRLAHTLVTLGHGARLLLVRALLERPRTRQELQGVLGIEAPGPLYHHLKALLAAGIVSQARRSLYEIAARQVVPVLTVLAAASDLAGHAVDFEPDGKE